METPEPIVYYDQSGDVVNVVKTLMWSLVGARVCYCIYVTRMGRSRLRFSMHIHILLLVICRLVGCLLFPYEYNHDGIVLVNRFLRGIHYPTLAGAYISQLHNWSRIYNATTNGARTEQSHNCVFSSCATKHCRPFCIVIIIHWVFFLCFGLLAINGVYTTVLNTICQIYIAIGTFVLTALYGRHFYTFMRLDGITPTTKEIIHRGLYPVIWCTLLLGVCFTCLTVVQVVSFWSSYRLYRIYNLSIVWAFTLIEISYALILTARVAHKRSSVYPTIGNILKPRTQPRHSRVVVIHTNIHE
jgi:hypothetical protein